MKLSINSQEKKHSFASIFKIIIILLQNFCLKMQKKNHKKKISWFSQFFNTNDDDF